MERAEFYERVLAGRLLTAVAKGMCSLVYNRQWHRDRVSCGVVGEDEFDALRQAEARCGALCAHGHMTAFERITATLESRGLIGKRRGDVFELLVASDEISDRVAMERDAGRVALLEALQAFLNFDFQPGWPAGYFQRSLVSEFVQAGLLDGSEGELSWATDVLFMGNLLGELPWDADPFFRRICTA